MAQQQKVPVFKRPEFRVGLVVSILAVITTSTTLFIFAANRSLFSGNPHFVLTRVMVNSSGYWRSNENEIMKLLKLEKGRSNLFALNLSDLVRKLDNEPNIEKATVARILPDTLQIEINERIPRAFLYGPKSGWVVDSDAILMESAKTLPSKGMMPVITGIRLKKTDAPGTVIPELKESLRIIMLSLTKYTDIKVNTINLGIPGEIHVYFNYKNGIDAIPAYFPAKDVDEKLKSLNLYFMNNSASELKGRILDLRFKDMLISAAAEPSEPAK